MDVVSANGGDDGGDNPAAVAAASVHADAAGAGAGNPAAAAGKPADGAPNADTPDGDMARDIWYSMLRHAASVSPGVHLLMSYLPHLVLFLNVLCLLYLFAPIFSPYVFLTLPWASDTAPLPTTTSTVCLDEYYALLGSSYLGPRERLLTCLWKQTDMRWYLGLAAFALLTIYLQKWQILDYARKQAQADQMYNDMGQQGIIIGVSHFPKPNSRPYIFNPSRYQVFLIFVVLIFDTLLHFFFISVYGDNWVMYLNQLKLKLQLEYGSKLTDWQTAIIGLLSFALMTCIWSMSYGIFTLLSGGESADQTLDVPPHPNHLPLEPSLR